ncbi:hypothetical protein FE783_12545 [Paenibacillus mesophilus]|uniref:Kelch repeat-containing protein n=1 Tax=Paenibacillus mesophilus TaxID=2582849 RepID=UPI00110D627D|nr:fibronectin type III domain-containing protein [Paenibacillus mesophilus]TMV49338.1 hypothetical protein FE783_12545 [Paenibacillus mesophilus]
MKRLKHLMFMVMMIVLAVPMFAVSAFATESWEQKADMPTGRYHLGVVEVNNKIYAVGGNDNNGQGTTVVEEYDPITDTWTTKAPIPVVHQSFAIATTNGKIYLFGGLAGQQLQQNTTYEYDPVGNAWTAKANMPTGRYHAAAATVNGKIYVVGGATGSGASKKLEEYDPATNTWTTKADMPTGRSQLGFITLNNKIYAIGGSITYNVVEEYNPITNTWATKANMPIGTSSSGYAVLNNKIYVMSGSTPDVNKNATQEYTPETNTWASKINIPTSRNAPGAATAYGKIYVIGGLNQLNKVEVYSSVNEPTQPQNLVAIAGPSQVALSWSAVSGATGYNVKRFTTAGGPYSTIASSVTGTTYTDTSVTNGTTYYYVVTAVNAGGESGNSNEASATPQAPAATNRALLTITLVSGLEKEYDLSMTEVNAFISWYNGRAAGTGLEVYTINKNFNKASFLSRKDYIAFDKIEMFEVNEYSSN